MGGGGLIRQRESPRVAGGRLISLSLGAPFYYYYYYSFSALTEIELGKMGVVALSRQVRRGSEKGSWCNLDEAEMDDDKRDELEASRGDLDQTQKIRKLN